MAREWRRLLDVPHIRDVIGPDVDPEAPHKAWPIPAQMRQRTLSAAGGRVLYVGDAARATDPMTGEGIAQALESGRRAAAAVEAAGPRDPAAAASRYTRSLRGMITDQRVAAALSGVLRTPAGARGAVRLSGAIPWTRSNFTRWLFEDYPRAVVITPSRWRPQVLHGPGAFQETATVGASGAPPATVLPHG
jgi:2-polyprenyl-6-methoxyphenol hydroxylase-like FAD-dependent oxidoreductase